MTKAVSTVLITSYIEHDVCVSDDVLTLLLLQVASSMMFVSQMMFNARVITGSIEHDVCVSDDV